MNKGFIKLDRGLYDEDFFSSERFTRAQAFIDLCFQAAYKEREFFVRGIKVTLKPYEIAISEANLAEKWQWSRNTVRKFLSELLSSGIIEQTTSKLINIITIKKYLVIEQQNEQQNTLEINDLSMSGTVDDEQQNEQQNEQLSRRKEKKDNIKEISDTNVSSIKKEKRFVKPTVDEIQAYINEKGYTFDAEAFFAHYESNGWKVGRNPMKSWKAACTTWSKNKNNNNNYGRETATEKVGRTIAEADSFMERLFGNIGEPADMGGGDKE